ncbi:repressor LexA [Desulfatibacillum alkenivorans DSM 16219]|jgi:repressor LexA|uniref:LexA repressor n=1 Tax=Desulfatibacillum alkenivorans DSM 16219 TaxID=1121393 RepID=A0A1M6N2K6_9BACT|nr:transcriptional repressor LexA [Desulfatibacillum alkenivorans]SHJ89896.1 repressor LexA [Desulfatibacillum alkenivorans DSM 16219]
MEDLTEKQSLVFEFIMEYTADHGYPPTVRELCDELGFKSPNTAHFHLKGLKDKGYIQVAKGKNRGITVLKAPPGAGGKIPLVGRIAAGAPILAVENVMDTLDVDRAFFGSSDAFSVRVEGDSMIEAHIEDGDYVVIKPTATPRNGDIVAALVNDEVTLKYFHRDGSRIELRPANARYKPFCYTEEDFIDVRVLGVMAGLIRKV